MKSSETSPPKAVSAGQDEEVNGLHLSAMAPEMKAAIVIKDLIETIMC